MKRPDDASRGAALTDLVLDLFRLNSLLLITGDRLVADLGLTSARWQVLGAIAQADRPQPVAWLARDMGANRQNVQRIVNDLHADGIVDFAANPHHRRAKLVLLTERGRKIYDEAVGRWTPLAKDLAAGLSGVEIEAAQRLMKTLRERLEGLSEDKPDALA